MTKVIYYTTIQKDNPVKDFIENLEERQQRKVSRIFFNIQKYGLTTAIPHIKKLNNTPLWEIRILGQDSIRIFYATMEENVIIALHGFIKKTQKTPLKELDIAMKRLVDWNIRMKTTT